MHYNTIIEQLNTLKDYYGMVDNKGDDNFILKATGFPKSIQELIHEDIKTVITIFDFIHKEIIIKSADMTLREIKYDSIFIICEDTPVKTKFIRFKKIITKWLLDIKFFEDTFNDTVIVTDKCDVDCDEFDNEFENNDFDSDNLDVNDFDSNESDNDDFDNEINDDDIKEHIINNILPNFKTYNRRINQQDVYDQLVKNGLVTGIHCQATGCGKSYSILEHLKFTNGKSTILFTERVSILADLFEIDNTSKSNADVIKRWKEMDICDLTGFDIINRVTIKKNDWMQLIRKATITKKPVLLIINRAYLTSKKLYEKINNENLGLVLHDECHNTSSDKCFNFLLHCKKQNIPIVGFSATPIRTNKKDRSRLLQIYSEPLNVNKLNLLTNYNMMFSIKNNLILPPEFHWYTIDAYNKIDEQGINTEDITNNDIKSVMSLLNDIVKILPNKKIVAWCGTIKMANDWKQKFVNNQKNYANLKDFAFGIDTSKNITNDYDTFKKSKGNMILFCACKHREGSDIKLLDCVMFLDKVKNRGEIPFIQSIGRVLRLCPETPTKTKGVIIDCIAKNNNYDKEFVDKILGYYLALENLSLDDDNKYVQYEKIKNNITFDKVNNQVSLTMGDKTININCNKLEWTEIIKKFDSVLKDNCEVDETTLLVIEYERDITKNKKLQIMSVKEYYDCLADYNLTPCPNEKYKILWTGWYNYLGIDTSKYPSSEKEWNQKCFKLGIKCRDDYDSVCIQNNLPSEPKEYYNSSCIFSAFALNGLRRK